MNLWSFLLLLLIAGIAGSIGRAISGYSHGGCLVSIALGFVGAVIGLWIANLANLPEMVPITVGGTTFPLIWSIIGAAIFVAIINFVSGNRRRRR